MYIEVYVHVPSHFRDVYVIGAPNIDSIAAYTVCTQISPSGPPTKHSVIESHWAETIEIACESLTCHVLSILAMCLDSSSSLTKNRQNRVRMDPTITFDQ